MKSDFVAYYLQEEKYIKIIENGQKFAPSYKPFLLIRILENYNENAFEGIICNGTVFNRTKCIKKIDAGSNSILIDYDTEKKGVFTFDKIRYFKITGIQIKSDNEGIIVFSFKYLDRPSFTKRNTAFMVMPFGIEKLNLFYEKNIKQFLVNSNLAIRVLRSDDFAGTDIIADTILNEIKKAEFIICDITNCNKNVFFEVGYAKALNKSIIFLLEQNQPAQFFDVNHIRRIEYSYEREAEFQSLLKATLISVRNSRID